MGSYAPPTITAAGLTIPSYTAIYNKLVASYQAVFGQNVSLDNSNADIQFIAILALLISDVDQALQLEYTNRSPATAIGAALDSLMALNGLARKTATFSTVSVTLTGTAGTIINNGVVSDVTFGFLWSLPVSVTIGGGGTVTVTATCQTIGAVNVGAGTVTGISTPTAGWTSVTNAAASSPGQAVESDSQLRTRQAISVELPSQTILAGTYAGVLAVPGVTRVQIDENTGGTTNGNSTPGHSIQAIVENGDQTAIATAIFNNRGLGCGTFGSVTVAITDPNTGVTMNISFNRPSNTNVYVVVYAHALSGAGLTSAQISAIQNGIANYINGLSIGGVVSFGELLWAATNAVNSNQEQIVVSVRSPLYLGTSPSPSTSTDITLSFGEAAVGLAANVTVNSV